MKAITPIIAIIVLLLITIAIAGTGWTYLSGYTESLVSKQIDVVDSFCVAGNRAKIIIRNTGTGTVSTDTVIVTDMDTGQVLNDEIVWTEQKVDDPSLMAYFNLDSPTNVVDVSGHGHTATLAGSGADPVWNSLGKINGAYDFKSGRYFSVPYDISLCPAELTIEFWFYNLDDGTGLDNGVITGAGGNGYSNGWRFLHRVNVGGDHYLQWQLRFIGGSAPQVADSSPLPLDEWYHAVGVYDGTRQILYVNGVEVDSNTNSNGINYTTSSTMRLGFAQYSFEGMIDEIKLYNRALSPEEIEDHANSTVHLEPLGLSTMTHTCSSGSCNYVLTMGSTSRKVRVNC